MAKPAVASQVDARDQSALTDIDRVLEHLERVHAKLNSVARGAFARELAGQSFAVRANPVARVFTALDSMDHRYSFFFGEKRSPAEAIASMHSSAAA